MHFGNFTDTKWISQEFSEDDAMWVKYMYSDMITDVSIAAGTICREAQKSL